MRKSITASIKSAPGATHGGAILRRKCACGGQASAGGECESCKKKELHRKAAGPGGPALAPPIVRDVLQSPGQPIDAATRGFMEPRFGHDFGKVRVHADEQATRSARQANALAYTVGAHVVVDKDRYEPQTTSGVRLMAHELAHVVQQTDIAGVPDAAVIGAPGDASEVEADRVADAVLRGGAEEGIAIAGQATTLRRQTVSKEATPTETAVCPGESRTIASFDVSPGNKRPWNLNQLTKDIVTAFRSSPLAYVTVLGAHPTKVNEDDPQGHAYERADTVRRALIQWIGPANFDEKRFQVGFSTASTGDPEVQVEISCKGQVISEGKSAGPEPTAAPPPKADPGKSASPPVPSLIPTTPYPASKTDPLSGFLATAPGQQFKANALNELKKVWTKTTVAEKIGIIVNLLAIAGITGYGLAKMSPSQQKGILDLIVGDDDKLLQQPLPSKTLLDHEFTF
jgi:hypothetical protein